jgi:hypothetical protein
MARLQSPRALMSPSPATPTPIDAWARCQDTLYEIKPGYQAASQ